MENGKTNREKAMIALDLANVMYDKISATEMESQAKLGLLGNLIDMMDSLAKIIKGK